MKMKEFWPPGGGGVPGAPLDPPLTNTYLDRVIQVESLKKQCSRKVLKTRMQPIRMHTIHCSGHIGGGYLSEGVCLGRVSV